MADLLTHLASALLPAALLPRGRWLGPVVLGTALPDLGARLPGLALERLHDAGLPVPPWALFPWDVLHMPSGYALLCVLIAVLFREDQRRVVFGGLLAGGALHLGLDVLQDHHGVGYHLWVPLSMQRFELAWIGSEATVPWALPLAGATALAWGVRWRMSPQTRISDQDPPASA